MRWALANTNRLEMNFSQLPQATHPMVHVPFPTSRACGFCRGQNKRSEDMGVNRSPADARNGVRSMSERGFQNPFHPQLKCLYFCYTSRSQFEWGPEFITKTIFIRTHEENF